MRRWHIAGRAWLAPPPADWPERLAQRLGQRPRRLGAWGALALHGALACLDAAGETALPDAALLSVSSVHGPDRALRASLAEAREDLPLPLGFLQSQPNQLLPALAQQLRWRGDGRSLSTRDPLLALALGLREAGAAGALLGWVAEGGSVGNVGGAAACSCWLRLLPADAATTPLRAVDFAALADARLDTVALLDGAAGTTLLAG